MPDYIFYSADFDSTVGRLSAEENLWKNER